MAKVVSVVNMKGGVGKSTITVNLAYNVAGHPKWTNKKALVIDLDPQFNSSQYMMGVEKYKKRLDAGEPTVWNIFEQHTQTPGGKNSSPLDPKSAIFNVRNWDDGSKLDIVPSQLELAYSLKNPAGKERLLEKFVKKIDQDYDLIVIDCPPTESVFTTAAYFASRYVLVPVKPDFLSTIGLPLLGRSLDEFHQQYDVNPPEVLGVVFNSSDNYIPEATNSTKDVMAVAKKQGWYVFENSIRYSRSYPKSAREGKPIFGVSYVHSKTANEFTEFAKEVATKVGL